MFQIYESFSSREEYKEFTGLSTILPPLSRSNSDESSHQGESQHRPNHQQRPSFHRQDTLPRANGKMRQEQPIACDDFKTCLRKPDSPPIEPPMTPPIRTKRKLAITF